MMIKPLKYNKLQQPCYVDITILKIITSSNIQLQQKVNKRKLRLNKLLGHEQMINPYKGKTF